VGGKAKELRVILKKVLGVKLANKKRVGGYGNLEAIATAEIKRQKPDKL